jgi:hypothetical protein
MTEPAWLLYSAACRHLAKVSIIIRQPGAEEGERRAMTLRALERHRQLILHLRPKTHGQSPDQ